MGLKTVELMNFLSKSNNIKFQFLVPLLTSLYFFDGNLSKQAIMGNGQKLQLVHFEITISPFPNPKITMEVFEK